MSFDVQNTARYLQKLSDAQLRSYTELNKGNPYIVALAVDESNRRKTAATAARGAQGQMPQPKVVDREISNMSAPMPEDVGIAQLPAGNMNFADGGIVAFAGGGDVERYNGEKSSYIPAENENPLSIGSFWNRWRASGKPLLPFLGLETTKPIEYYPDSTIGGKSPSNKELEEQLGLTGTGGAGGADAVKGDKPPAPPPAAGSPAAPRTDAGFGALMKSIQGSATPADQVNPYVKQMEDLTATRVKSREKEAEGLEAIQKQFSDIYKGREERLAKSEGELAGMKDQYFGLALLQAGAAMMSTPGSLGVALGKGVDVGSKQYIAGMDKINAAKDKLSDARDRLEELQAQRGELSAREMLKAKSAIDSEKAAGQELLIKANMDLYKISREEAIKRLELQTRVGIAQLEDQSRRAVAGMPSGMERLYSTLGGGDVKKGMEAYAATMGPEAKGENTLIAQYAKDPIALKMLEQTNPQLAAMVKARMQQMMIPGVQSTPTGPARP